MKNLLNVIPIVMTLEREFFKVQITDWSRLQNIMRILYRYKNPHTHTHTHIQIRAGDTYII